MAGIIYKELSYELVGMLYKAHRELGLYRNEKQYGDYFEILLKEKKIKYIREYKIADCKINNKIIRCVCDFVIEDKIILEFKSKNYLTKEDYYQTQRYLSSLNLKLGLLINFRQTRLSPKRILNLNIK